MPKKIAGSLAQSLASQLQGKELITAIDKVLADSENGGLQVLKHGDAARMAMDMYKEYVSDTDYTYFVNFVKQLDDLILKFRGNQPLDLTEEDDDEEEDYRPRKKGKGKGKFGGKPLKKVAPASSEENNSEGGGDEEPDAENSVVISKVIANIRKVAREKAKKKYGAKLLESNR